MSQSVKHHFKLAGSVLVAAAVLPLQGLFLLRSLDDNLFCYNCSLRVIVFDTGLSLRYIDTGMVLLTPLIGTAAVYVLMKSRRGAWLSLGTFLILDLMIWLALGRFRLT